MFAVFVDGELISGTRKNAASSPEEVLLDFLARNTNEVARLLGVSPSSVSANQHQWSVPQ